MGDIFSPGEIRSNLMSISESATDESLIAGMPDLYSKIIPFDNTLEINKSETDVELSHESIDELRESFDVSHKMDRPDKAAFRASTSINGTLFHARTSIDVATPLYKQYGYSIMSFDIGDKNMAMACINAGLQKGVPRGKKPAVDFIPQDVKIIKLVKADLGLGNESTLAQRAIHIALFLLREMPEDFEPNIITIERQFKSSKPRGTVYDPHYAENHFAETLSLILLGLVVGRFPGAKAKVVVPMLARQDVAGTQYMRKLAMQKKGLEILSAMDKKWYEYTKVQNPPTDICEAFMMSLGAIPCLFTVK